MSWSLRRGERYSIHSADNHSPGDRAAMNDPRLAFAFAVARGLEARPRCLPSRFLYDDVGSRLFDDITAQPEYYQTRTEDRLLREHAQALRALVGDTTLVELGSGSSRKTRHLLAAWCAAGPSRYLPVDISVGALEPACRRLTVEFPNLHVEGIAASWERALPLLATQAPAPRLLLFLGSSIGNLDRGERDAFLDELARTLAPGDRLLVGLDLVKDPARLEAAYNDAAGLSARFTLNLFARIERELGARIPHDAIEHVAFYDARLERIEIYARFRREVVVELPDIERRYRIAAGEQVRTEISAKFHAEAFAAEAARFGYATERIDRDPERRYALVLLRRRATTRRDAPRPSLETLLRRVRLRTLELVAPLTDEELRAQPHRIMSPVVWDLCHIAEFERRWLDRALAEDARDDGDDAGAGLATDFDPVRTPRAVRGDLMLPSGAEAARRLEQARQATERRLQRVDAERLRGLPSDAPPATDRPLRERLLDGGYVYRMVAQHEAQHQETILQALQLRDDPSCAPLAAAPCTTPWIGEPPQPEPRVADERILIPAGPFLMGTDDRTGAYDNERPAHLVELPAYRIDAAPVTNAQYLAFIDDGGYHRPELWSAEGQAWLRETAATAPLAMRLVDGEWQARRFGQWRPIDPHQPVMHVCWFEAEAWARWAGRRLPTEAEWEKAAAWDPERGAARRYPWGDAAPDVWRANLDQRWLEPAPVGAYPSGRSFYGCHQMLGDVWEWTASRFAPYPGFTAFPYRGYSAVYFAGEYRVLRGGSFATLGVAIRNGFRNWDFPQRRQLFAGFRCVSDV